MKLLNTVVLLTSLAMASSIFFTQYSTAESPEVGDLYFVYEKDGHCTVTDIAPTHWKANNGASWVMVSSDLLQSKAVNEAIEAGCELPSS